MNIPGRMREEISGWSSWFTIAVAMLFVLYILAWSFTIYLSYVQQTRGLEPLLPVVPADVSEYVALAHSLVTGQGFSVDGVLETLRTPGYPLFIAVLSHLSGTYFIVTLFQIFLAFASAVLIRRIGVRCANRTVGELAAILTLANPVTLTLSVLLYSDVLFLFLYLLGFVLLMDAKATRLGWRILFAVLLFAAAIYVRPIGLFALPLLYAPLALSALPRKKIVLSLIGLTVGISLLLVPWAWRNYERTGVFNFSSIQAFNLTYAVERYEAQKDGISIAEEEQRLAVLIGAKPEDWRDIRLSQKENDAMLALVRREPFAYVKWHVLSTAPFLFPSTVDFLLHTYATAYHVQPPHSPGITRLLSSGNVREFVVQGLAQQWWKVAERFFWLVVVLLSLYGFVHHWRERVAWLCAFIIVYHMLLSGPAAGPRYALQAWPFLFLLFAMGCMRLTTLRAKRSATSVAG